MRPFPPQDRRGTWNNRRKQRGRMAVAPTAAGQPGSQGIYNFGGSGSNTTTMSCPKVSSPFELKFISKSYEMKFLWEREGERERGSRLYFIWKERRSKGKEWGERGESLLSIVDSAGGLIPYFIFLQTLESGALNLLSLSVSQAPASLLQSTARMQLPPQGSIRGEECR